MNSLSEREAQRIVEQTRCWLQLAVVGLDLCPFAKAPLAKGRVRFALCASDDPRVLLDALCDEMDALLHLDPAQVETTLLIHPRALLDFEDFNDFLEAADAALEDRGLEGVLQIASFHPDYRFADTGPDDLANATNRSPYPILQLLREASVERAVESFPEAGSIYERNIERLEALGDEGWNRLRDRWLADGG